MDLRLDLAAVENRREQLWKNRKKSNRPIEHAVHLSQRRKRRWQILKGPVFNLPPDPRKCSKRERWVQQPARDVDVTDGGRNSIFTLLDVRAALQQVARHPGLRHDWHTDLGHEWQASLYIVGVITGQNRQRVLRLRYALAQRGDVLRYLIERLFSLPLILHGRLAALNTEFCQAYRLLAIDDGVLRIGKNLIELTKLEVCGRNLRHGCGEDGVLRRVGREKPLARRTCSGRQFSK